MRKRKFGKVVHKKEELPSFLKNLQEIPQDIDIPQNTKKNNAYLGPVFFGGDPCIQRHPPHHLAPLTSFHNVQYFAPLKENILQDIFKVPSIKTKSKVGSPVFRPIIRKAREFVDLFTHRCPGVRKIFAPDLNKLEGLGRTVSKIEGETSREIPFYRVKKVISRSCVEEEPKPELEIVTLSDIREERIKFLPYKERIAHAHFPKEFATVEVIGPTIPASIIITKLPSKRQTSFEIDAHLKSNAKKAEEGTSEETEQKTAEELTEDIDTGVEEEEVKSEESSGFLATEEESAGEVSIRSDKRPSEETEEGGDRTESKVISESKIISESKVISDTEIENEGAEEATEDEERNASELLAEEAEDFQEAEPEENPPEEDEE